MSDSLFLSKIQQIANGLPVKPSTETHLPIEIHLQRMIATPVEKEILYHVEEGELVALNLAHSHLSDEGLKVLAEFSALRSLNLTGTSITKWDLPPTLEKLEYLNLARCKQLTRVVFPKAFPKLKWLWIEESKVETLELKPGFSSLEVIFARDNALQQVVLPDKMDSLRFLDFMDNQIHSFETQGNYPHCWTLYLENNQLKGLGPYFLDAFPNLGRLRLDGNPLHESILSNIGEDAYKTLEFVKRYLAELKKGSTTDRETKVLLLGNGNVGKSCLVKRMVYDRFIEEWNSTHAISLEQYPPKWEDAAKEENLVDPYLLNLWDFGGQDIYHATHRLFMHANAVYLLLWDHKTEQAKMTPHIEGGEEREYENHKLPYWLSYARSQGKDSPIIVVQTKIDRDEKQVGYKADIETRYHDQFSFLDFHYIESQEDNWDQNGYKELARKIQTAVGKLKPSPEMPKAWRDIRQEIRQLQHAGKKRLELKDFYHLAKGVENPMDVLTWLTQSGVFFYKEGLFNDEIVINQAWAIEAIYTLFDREKFYYSSLAAKGGEFSGRELAKIWKSNTEAEQELFVSFMLSCELCFETTEKDPDHYHTSFQKRTFIAPQLLPTKDESMDVTNLLEIAWENKNSIHLRFEHEFLHYGVIQSFIVRTQDWAPKKGIWKTGILLKNEGEMVQVEAWDQRVDVKATPNSQGLLRKIRKELIELQGKDVQEYVSPDGQAFALRSEWEEQARIGNSMVTGYWGEDLEKGNPIPIENLQVFRAYDEGIGGEKGERYIQDMMEEGAGTTSTQSDEPKLPPKDRPRVYFSYAWGDPEEEEGNSREDFVDALYESLVKEKEEYQILRDKMNIEYGGLISEFIKDIGKGDLVLVFISKKYLCSPYCMWELREIARNSKFDKSNFSERILTVFIESIKLDRPKVLTEFFKHWQKEKSEWHEFIQIWTENGFIKRAQTERYHKVNDICSDIGDLLDWLSDLNASTIKLLEENDYALVKEAIQNRLGGA